MNILKAINAGFTKFWRWIKETAWVQPLLIVGGIFAIIFSISKFSAWFGTMAVGSSASYFTSYRLALENEGKEGYDTNADKLTYTINGFSFGDYASYDDLRAALDEQKVIENYGEKYYLILVSDTCDGCEKAQDAFDILTTNWNTDKFRINDGGTFRLHSIFVDEASTNDKDYDLDEDKQAFSRYVKKFDGLDLWTRTAGRLEEVPYKENASVSSTKYETMENAESGSWETPTIFFVDWSKAAFEAGRAGISEVLFGFNVGSDNYQRATLLQQMWNHVPLDSADKDSTNPFRPEYNH
ncbi:MAG: hypothetical protein K6E59_05030 [Bacilli bacterium]|nr:hypothetical protein [Bacilli bacterium]